MLNSPGYRYRRIAESRIIETESYPLGVFRFWFLWPFSCGPEEVFVMIKELWIPSNSYQPKVNNIRLKINGYIFTDSYHFENKIKSVDAKL